MEIGDSERLHVSAVTMISVYADFWNMGCASEGLNIIEIEVSECDDEFYIGIFGKDLWDWLGGWSIGEEEGFHEHRTFLDSTY